MHYGASWQPCGAVGLGLSQVLSRARSLMQGGLVVARGVAWALLGRGTAALRRPGGQGYLLNTRMWEEGHPVAWSCSVVA